MRSRLVHIVFALLALFTLCSCSGKGKVLSAKKMSEIYMDFYLADQWLRDNPGERAKADTTLFFDPILSSHHVTFKDFDRSLQYYLGKPQEFSQILTNAAEKLRLETERLEEIVQANLIIEARNRKIENYEPQDFTADSLFLNKKEGSYMLRPFEPDSSARISPLVKERVIKLTNKPLIPKNSLRDHS